ncbi:MAG: hypothetical protein RL375_3589 [Pseudomonadota bacterium]
MTLHDDEIHSARILIVDDQASNVHLLERLLAEAGYTELSSTMDPLEVCRLHRRNDYDLILLDLQLPVMDGFQVMAALQASTPECDYLPVIVLTAQPGHKLRALQAGAKDFISKPFDLVEVKTRIRNMLEVRLLYRRIEAHNHELERVVQERTAELRESEARYRSLTELASDWYWEQDDTGRFTRVSGPVFEMLGLRVEPLEGGAATWEESAEVDAGWNEEERNILRATIAARQPFLDFAFSRIDLDGSQRQFRVSGEPIFTNGAHFVGYRGIGVETTHRPLHVG